MEAEPSPRWGHHSALVKDKVYVSGGRTNSGLASSVHSFDPFLEFWTEENATDLEQGSIVVPVHLQVA
jgi:hypothetical protein